MAAEGVEMRTQPADYDPPPGHTYFSLRMSCLYNRRLEVSVPRLTDEELEWVARVVVAELQTRHSKTPDAMPGSLVIAAPSCYDAAT